MTSPWSTIPVTGAQHDAWMAEEREEYPPLALGPILGNLRTSTVVDTEAGVKRVVVLTDEDYDAMKARGVRWRDPA